MIRAVAALALVAGVVPATPLLAPVHAIVGRPMTPVSYAGVARRSTYRAVAYSSTAAARQCYTRYDSYGRAVTTCY